MESENEQPKMEVYESKTYGKFPIHNSDVNEWDLVGELIIGNQYPNRFIESIKDGSTHYDTVNNMVRFWRRKIEVSAAL